MNDADRNYERCAFRSDVRQIQGREVACCGFLKDVTGVDQSQLCDVAVDACKACVDLFSPTIDDLNPVVASLLYRLTEQIVDDGGVPGCDSEKAQQLNALADQNIPVLSPDEDDCATHTSLLGRSLETLPAIEQLLPKPDTQAKAKIETWAVGVTTAPRRIPTLDQCLDSLIAADFHSVRLFVDGPVPVEARFENLEVTLRKPQMGAWPSYLLALTELMMRDPDADAFMLVQDDVVFFAHPGLREYLQDTLWPDDRPSIASLFCPSRYTQESDGWQTFPADQQWVMGAETFLFSPSAARQFIADETVISHRWCPGKEGLVDIDDVIGEWASRTGVPVHYPTPSLVQHIGHASTLWPSVRALGRRRADRFAGDLVTD